MKTLLGFLAGTFLLFQGCSKGPGEGGNSSIRGNVWVRDFNGTFTTLNGQYPGADVDVFIIYGDEPSYGDKTSTNFDGTFEFKYLREGSYKVYCYSKDSTMTSVSGEVHVIKSVDITDKKQTVDAGRLTIYN